MYIMPVKTIVISWTVSGCSYSSKLCVRFSYCFSCQAPVFRHLDLYRGSILILCCGPDSSKTSATSQQIQMFWIMQRNVFLICQTVDLCCPLSDYFLTSVCSHQPALPLYAKHCFMNYLHTINIKKKEVKRVMWTSIFIRSWAGDEKLIIQMPQCLSQ